MVGADILSRLPEDDKAPMLVAYEHHMNVDGGGYPERSSDYVAHPFSRMVAIADRYANLVDPGIGVEGLTPDRAIMQILAEAGSALDPLFARLFAKAMGVFPVGCLVRLSDQSVGVVSRNGADMLKPRVRIAYDQKGHDLEEPFDVDLAESDLEIVEVVSPDSLNVDISERL
jgi:HD-GYP domain-containing protein (c-di-GMP phosphodiesterase class II)